jgi:signal peptide peptidase SppA
MEQRDRHLLRAICETPWAILPEKLLEIEDLVRLHASGIKLSDEEIRARIGAARQRAAAPPAGGIMVLPLYGTIAQRMNMIMAMSGGTSTELFGQAFRQAVADPAVGAIVLDVDSPGGSVFGVPELADVVYDARGKKRVVAVANSWAASAAYWVASQADELVVTPSGEVGSIGVLAIHEDLSKMAEMMGVKVSYITAGKYKAEGNPFEPLDDDARDYIQRRVNDYHDMFVRTVARGRDVLQRDVRENFGQGRMVSAERAVSLRMADRVDTLEATIARLQQEITGTVAPAAQATGGDLRRRQQLAEAWSSRTET